MSSAYPSDYEDIFQLILNLVEEIKRQGNSERRVTAEDLESYFHRLTLGTLGEYEFMRRMAFYGYPVMRIAALPALWTEYSQPVSPDFIVSFGDKKACVEVKNYKWDSHPEGIIVPQKSIENCIKFKRHFKFDQACLALKRFERWYLLDLEQLPKDEYSHDTYLVKYPELSGADLLKEQGITLQLWSTKYQTNMAAKYAPLPDNFKNEGIIYEANKLSGASESIQLKYCCGENERYPKSEDCQVRQLHTPQKDIIILVHKIVSANLKEIYSCGYDWQCAVKMNVEDILPSIFSIHDRLTGKNGLIALKNDIDTLKSSGVLYTANRKGCLFYLYGLAARLHKDLNEKLKSNGLTFKDIMKYMQAIRSFKKAF